MKLSLENIRVALRSVRSQKLRTTLTVFIIAIGITALVGILTAIDALKYKINSDFSDMGANTITVVQKRINVRSRQGKQEKESEEITYEQARKFKETYGFPAEVSVSATASRTATVKYRSEKTNPNIKILGGDEAYLSTTGYRIHRGRNFSPREITRGGNVAIIGHKIITTLFKEFEDPLGKTITIGSDKYRVIGILEEKGSSMGFSGDDQCIIPVSNVEQDYARPGMSFSINIMTPRPEQLAIAADEAIATFRVLRKVPPSRSNDFELVKSDNLASRLIEQLSFISLTATIVGVITLLGAAIGLMNIMLVSVTERTREIGIRKSMGATPGTIRNQFLVESVVVGQLGGLAGIVIGILAGNSISFFVGGGFLIPWTWIIVGVVLCLLVGIASGYYPAQKASRLDPIESLRHE